MRKNETEVTVVFKAPQALAAKAAEVRWPA